LHPRVIKVAAHDTVTVWPEIAAGGAAARSGSRWQIRSDASQRSVDVVLEPSPEQDHESMTRRRSSLPFFFLVAYAAIAMLLLSAPASASAADHGALPTVPRVAHATQGPADGCDAVPGRLLVRFSRDAGRSDRAATRAEVHGRSLHDYRLVPGLELLSTDLPVDEAIGALRGHGSVVAAAQPDCRVHATRLPDDVFLDAEWGLHNTGQFGGIAGRDIDAAAGWDIRTDATAAPVAIIDTGMNLDHPDLVDNLWTNPGEIPGNGVDDDHNGFVDDVHGFDFVDDDAVPEDENGHGTHVAGIIGARGDNNFGVAGVAWTATLMPLRVLDANGSGTVDAIIRALDYAAANGARITNNSYGGRGFDPALFDAFAAAGDAGMLQVVAAGNDGSDTDVAPESPGSFRLSSLISVAATDPGDGLAAFSNFGRTTVDIGAPGVHIASTWPAQFAPFASFVFLDGTSMATPMVSGVAALVAAQNPTFTPAQLHDRILATARPNASLAGKTVTGGVVDLGRALDTPFDATVALSQASDSGVSSTDRITNANPLVFDVTFPRAITGLAAGDFVRGGTATGCGVGTPTGSGRSFHVAVSACSSGSVTLTLKKSSVADAITTLGPSAAVTSPSVVVDHARPSASGLVVAPRTGTTLSGTSIRLHLTWSASDTGGSGIADHELQVSTDGGATWTNVSTTLANPVANVVAASSGTIRYRVRAVDGAGNVGAFLTGPNESPRLVQETAAAITYSAGWTTAASSSYSGGTVRFATTAGTTASFTFTGRSIAFVTTRAANRGQVRIFLDGTLQTTLDLGGATTFRSVVWQRTFTTSVARTVRLEVVGTAGRPRVDLDAFAVLS
jgi:subtilisin family serine protease